MAAVAGPIACHRNREADLKPAQADDLKSSDGALGLLQGR